MLIIPVRGSSPQGQEAPLIYYCQENCLPIAKNTPQVHSILHTFHCWEYLCWVLSEMCCWGICLLSLSLPPSLYRSIYLSVPMIANAVRMFAWSSQALHKLILCLNHRIWLKCLHDQVTIHKLTLRLNYRLRIWLNVCTIKSPYINCVFERCLMHTRSLIPHVSWHHHTWTFTLTLKTILTFLLSPHTYGPLFNS